MHRTPATPTRRHRLLGDVTWQSEAACRSADLNTFYPDPADLDSVATAKALCARCPVRRVCLDAALETNDPHGIRGGLTEEERAPLHENVALRMDRTRVEEALAGRDIHLTKSERRAVAHAAHLRGISEERLAWILKVTFEHAQKLLRAARLAEQHREAHNGAQKKGDPRSDFGTAA
ncbi:WhiB family transcriptional regulator [Streptomyces acidiscabies]|uniref:Transcriptional regulator WhiB n=1 Tax=Streptomyces acidiscabies TaxID=42234 RepID=A0AAP6BLP0_9ACTN|nr:WhiB family transcriptional regulator [Streptomyces acidiscabies]MBP5936737.1 WhiB family transcriptional regulator [Streptomyces sp. LBUM 1476]MBZ3915257.1 WhiB family transcriptional regulator [Streptomyces acidiscabies]MDX2967018.1 WhiB family transcriptional regulator [Streptomyces acidiscabies]MDX3021319.1 WhiB family transcriptional regulator [Streptomyces acidiscabies]MDX3793428.1 WhiB family transcriptional regulator [Streptomyces acidiscabies]